MVYKAEDIRVSSSGTVGDHGLPALKTLGVNQNQTYPEETPTMWIFGCDGRYLGLFAGMRSPEQLNTDLAKLATCGSTGSRSETEPITKSVGSGELTVVGSTTEFLKRAGAGAGKPLAVIPFPIDDRLLDGVRYIQRQIDTVFLSHGGPNMGNKERTSEFLARRAQEVKGTGFGDARSFAIMTMYQGHPVFGGAGQPAIGDWESLRAALNPGNDYNRLFDACTMDCFFFFNPEGALVAVLGNSRIDHGGDKAALQIVLDRARARGAGSLHDVSGVAVSGSANPRGPTVGILTRDRRIYWIADALAEESLRTKIKEFGLQNPFKVAGGISLPQEDQPEYVVPPCRIAENADTFAESFRCACKVSVSGWISGQLITPARFSVECPNSTR